MPTRLPRLRPVAIAFALLVVAMRTANAFDATSPVGLWRSIDDATGRQRALIRIDERDGRFFGRIESTDDPDDIDSRCKACKDDRKGAPIIGLEIIRDVVRVADGFDRGTILDARNGSVYGCRLHLEKDGSVLVVRGYLGVSLLGGSRRWYRVS